MLIDHALTTESGLPRQDRHAVGFDAAIAAAFADLVIDEDTARRLRQNAAFTSPPLLRGAHLVVDEHGHAGDFPQLPLHAVDLIAVTHRHAAEGGMAVGVVS